ncbi:MAG: DNA translocase FtsK 4TM domain-containing protein [Alphaproteobacteria bacterium]|nr:DNA translocase FtsK 4TM domain-containing protein [Alphaproteobacteria bacterium]
MANIYNKLSYLMLMLAGVILLAMFFSYNPYGASLNSTGMFEGESSIEIFRNVIADIFFQIFGKAAYLIPIFFISLSWQLYTKKNVPLLKYKVMSFFYAIITIPPLIGGGVLGVYLAIELPLFTQLFYIFTILAIVALGFAFSVSLQDIITAKNAFVLFAKFVYRKIMTLKNHEQAVDYNYKSARASINIMPDLESVRISNKIAEDEIAEEPKFNEDFKHSIFYKNIQATQQVEEEEIAYEDEPIADLEKDFVAAASAFHSPKKEEPQYFPEPAFQPQPFQAPQPIPAPIPQPIPSAPVAIAKNILGNDVQIHLSKENEQMSTLKDKPTRKYHIPLNFLDIKPQKNSISTVEIKQNAINLEQIIQEFGVNAKVVNIITGPVVTLYEVAIPAGVKTSKITTLETDIALRMKATSVRIAIVPGKDVVGVEIPNSNRKTVFLKEVLQSKAFKESTAKLPVALGYDINGNAIVADLATMPHLLIAGTTGSGKSVGVNGMILSLLYKLSYEQCKLIMIDPKMLEFSVYQDIPHLLNPVVVNPKKAVLTLNGVVKEMEKRYYQMSLLGVRNITGFNEKLKNIDEIAAISEKTGQDFQNMPYIVVIIDEMADLMMVAGKEVEIAVQRLAQMARAAGIHLIMATQRPSVNVITGTIKANFPTRISFQVGSGIDSKTIINETGAEQLLGKGDMLFMSGAGRIQRVHGAFVEDSEVSSIVDYLKELSPPDYTDIITNVNITAYDTDDEDGEDKDEFYSQVIELIQTEQKISTSLVQRKFQIGYNRAARIMEQLEEDGIISKANAMGKREILIK